LQSVVPTAVQQQQAPQTPQGQPSPSISEITRSDQSESRSSGVLSGPIDELDSLYDPSYSELKAASSRNKRQRVDQGLGGMFDMDRSHELEADLHDATYEKD